MTDPAVQWAGSARSRALAWTLAGFAGFGFAALCLLDFRHDSWSALLSDLSGGVLLVLFFVSLGTLLELRQPANPIGWLLTAGGLSWLVNGSAESLARHGIADGHADSLVIGVAAALNQNLWVLGVVSSVGLPLLLFPNGQTRSPRWRWVLLAMVAGCALTLLGSAASTAPIISPVDPAVTLHYPWGLQRLSLASSVLRGLGVPLLLVTMTAAVGGIAVRFRTATGVQRQQLRWVRAGAGLAVGSMLAYFIGSSVGVPRSLLDLQSVLSIGLLPVTFTVAILRYRLYDLDRVVSRTVTYTAVTGLLVAVYVGLVTAVSRLTPSGSSLAVASSTLAVAALFQPVRRRVQLGVDRRFNRARYDADRTVDAFRRRLREEVDLGAVRAELLTVAQQTLQPTSVALWLRETALVTP